MEPHEWRDIEPHVTGVRAIHSPRTGIVDWGLVASHYAGMAPPPRLNRFVLSPASSPRLSLNPTRLIMQMTFGTWGGHIVLNQNVLRLETCDRGLVSLTCASGSRYTSKHAITCAGAHSDRIAKASGGSSSPNIVPFRSAPVSRQTPPARSSGAFLLDLFTSHASHLLFLRVSPKS